MAESKKNDKIEVEGKVTEVLKGSDYLVELPNGHTNLCFEAADDLPNTH